MRYIQKEESNVGMIVIAVVLVAIIIGGSLVAYGYFTRASSYANDPAKPPAGSSGDPSWQTRFDTSVTITTGVDVITGKYAVTKVDAYQHFIEPMKTYDGQPWSMSVFPTSWWSNPDSVTVSYELTLGHGRISYTDSGTFKVYKSEDYTVVGQHSKWFFFWADQVGDWSWSLKVSAKGETGSTVIENYAGTFHLATDGGLTQ